MTRRRFWTTATTSVKTSTPRNHRPQPLLPHPEALRLLNPPRVLRAKHPFPPLVPRVMSQAAAPGGVQS
jgi:hypothetical protein